MLTGLRLGNFKPFAATQRLPLRPLTLIFGPNSSGKSSLIHGLILARHALESGELDVHRTTIGGEAVDLGGFRQYVHRRSALHRVEWAAEIDAAQLQGRLAELLAPAVGIMTSVEIGMEHVERTTSRTVFGARTGQFVVAEVPTGELVPSGSPQVQRYEISVDGNSILRMSRRRDGDLQLDQLDHQHPVFRGVIKAIVETATTTEVLTTADYEGVDEAITTLVPNIRAQLGKFLPSGLLPPERLPVVGEQSMLFPISRGHRKEDLAAAMRFFLPRTLDELIRGVNDTVGQELSRLRYLGPLRSYPPRHLAFAQHHDPNWFAGGGYAWDVVRRDEHVRNALNSWLKAPDRLQSPYELIVRELVGIDQLEEPLYRGIQEIEIGMRDEGDPGGSHQGREYDPEPPTWGILDPESEAAKLTEIIRAADMDKLQELILIDRRSNTIVTHRDVGIGVSQVLPVLVAAYASRASILAMEQPEIHLHPALQAELGDVFIESALGGRGNTFILETHSEHLILRLLRRIRETTDGELPPDLTPIRPEHVAVLSVLPDNDGAKVVEIPIRPDGEFAERWPQGFFAERAKELF
jgi:AAA ATPase domain